jgi:hypothetical protein
MNKPHRHIDPSQPTARKVAGSGYPPAGVEPTARKVTPPNHEPHLDDLPHLLPGLTRLAELLLISRARGEDAWQRAACLSDLAPYGLTLSDLGTLVTAGLVAVLPSPSERGQGEGGIKASAASNRRKANAHGGVGRSATGGFGVRRAGGRRGKGGSKANSPKVQITSRSLLILTDAGLAYATKQSRIVAGSGYPRAGVEPSAREPSPSGRGQGEGGLHATGLATQPGASSPQPSTIWRGRGEGAPPSVSPSLVPSVAPSPPLSVSPSPPLSVPPPPPRSPLLPAYDIDTRELSVSGVVILRLPVQARNLAAVLTALEQSGWKPRVPKPLNGRPDGAEPQHLADAVYGLNHHQSLIEFRTDGGAIRWEWRVPTPQPYPPANGHRIADLNELR